MKTTKFGLMSILFLFTLNIVSAMQEMSHKITIGSRVLDIVESVNIETSQDLLSDVCRIRVPSQIYGIPLDVESYIKRGDPVIVELGYNEDLTTEFRGYLRAVYAGNHRKGMILECEDSMYLTRQYVAPKVLTNVTVQQIIQYVIDQVNPQIAIKFDYKSTIKGYKWDRFVIHNATGWDILDKLRQESGLVIYARDNTIYAHMAFTENSGTRVKYDFYENIEDSDGLEYTKEQDRRIKIKVVGRTKTGAKITVEAGQDGGDTRIYQRPTVSDRETLYSIARAELAKMQYEGYRGSVRGWLEPYCEVGYSARIVDEQFPERDGQYYVHAVAVEFSRSGGIRTIELGRRLV